MEPLIVCAYPSPQRTRESAKQVVVLEMSPRIITPSFEIEITAFERETRNRNRKFPAKAGLILVN
jgi:hypothetical protein